MKERGYTRAVLGLGLLLCSLFTAQGTAGAGEKRAIDPKRMNVSLEVPVFLPPENAEGGAEKGSLVFGTRTERGMFERLFAVYWGKERPDVMAPFAAGRYELVSEITADFKDGGVDGHTAGFSRAELKITHPCGQVSGGNMLVCRFYCPETKRHFLALDLSDTVTGGEFLEIMKSFKCH